MTYFCAFRNRRSLPAFSNPERRKMKKHGIMATLSMLALVCLTALPAFSQSIYNLKRAELEIHVGPAIPLGSFGQTAFQGNDNIATATTLNYHGAKVGVNYGLAFGYYASPNWGVVLLFNGHSYGVKTGDEGFSAYQPNYPWKTTETDKWTEFMAMAGLTYRCMIVDRLLFSARAYLGYAHLMSPFYRSEAQMGSNLFEYTLHSDSEPQFGYGAGVALKYLVGRGFHLDLRCEYMAAVPFYFRNVGSQVSMSGQNVQTSTPHDEKYTFHERFQSLNVSLGFTVAF